MSAQTVVGTTSQILDDGTVHTVATYSDGSRTDTWTPAAGSPAANAQTLYGKAAQALANNATYLALPSPSTAQNTAQIKALTRQVNAVLRLLVVGDTSTISDT